MESYAVTGAFGYSGRRIAERLLAEESPVRTLTNSPNRPNPFHRQIEVFPYNFDRFSELVRSLQGVTVLFNTYWVRFNHKAFKHEEAVQNTLTLFRAAKEAGVRRVVHVSITNPSESSPYEYFRGKARLEHALKFSGLSYAILRPAVLFGGEDILINNVAYLLRHFPVFAIPGSGEYRLQPIHVDDLADLAVEQASRQNDIILDAIGPENFTFTGLVETLKRIVKSSSRLIHLPPAMVTLAAKTLSRTLGDVLITPEEVKGLMAGLLYTVSPPTGKTSLTSWAEIHAPSLGTRYHSELARRQNREAAYQDL